MEVIGWIVIIIIIAIITKLIIAFADDLEMTDEKRYYVGDKCIGLSPRKGYIKENLYCQGLSKQNLGKFNGKAIVTDECVEIYNDSGLHLGGIAASPYLVNYIKSEGGSVHAYGYVAKNSTGMYGMTCIESDKTQVTKRNKPYKTE